MCLDVVISNAIRLLHCPEWIDAVTVMPIALDHVCIEGVHPVVTTDFHAKLLSHSADLHLICSPDFERS